MSFLNLPYSQIILNEKDVDRVSHAQEVIKTNNLTYINATQLTELIKSEHTGVVFLNNVVNTKKMVANCLQLIALLKTKLYDAKDHLGLEYLYHFYTLFNQLSNVLEQNDFVTDLKSVQALFRELLNSETLDFQGEPLEGLQIMGMLESRNLDYERVIITSVNEGVLPSGKSNNSFIPFDLKVKLGLPTYKEKDAVYTYHFYRLLQRTKEVYLLYNTEPDVLEGGEASRLITQLLTEKLASVTVSKTIATPPVSPNLIPKKTIHKDAGLLERIAQHAKSGFSPTSLSNYIRNPIDFYKRNLLGIDDVPEVEETVAANTFGTILHDSLEDLYQPFIGGAYLEIEKLKEVKKNIRPTVSNHFMKVFVGGDFSTGQNLIAYNVVVRYIENFIDLEIEELKEHSIRIVGLEQKLSAQISLEGRTNEINLKGKLDRIDEYDGTLRIIDFKTGKVTQGQVEIVEWPEIISEYEYSKAFQLLCYAYMYFSKNAIDELESGIYSFKNTSVGLMRFATKEARRSRKKNTIVSQETIALFEEQLKSLIAEILDPKISFEEKEV